MKKTFILFLCCSILFYGCYAYSPLTREDLLNHRVPPGNDILVTLIDGAVIKCQPYHHIYTTESADFIFGSGKRKHRFHLSEHREFVGMLQRSSIDSLRVMGIGTDKYLMCYLPDSTDIYFLYGDYIIVTPDQPPGLWCAGIQSVDGKDSVFSGRIPNERIERVETKEINALSTIGGAVFVIVVVVPLFLAVIYVFTGPHKLNGK
ncbi:MAG: hypothetical protein ABSB78_09470 [Bacteroidota bacterium]